MTRISYTKAHRPNVEKLTAEVQFLGAEGEADNGMRRFQMVGYTGAEVSRLYGRAVFDLSGIEHKGRVPILLNHDETQIAGYADRVEMTDRGLELSGYLSRSTESGLQVAALSDEGFPWEASVGLQVTEWEDVARDGTAKVNGVELSGPVSVGRKARLLETSFVTAGADKQTEAVVMNAKENDMENDTREGLATFLAAFDDDRAGWAAQQFAAGKSLDEAKAELAAEQEAAKAAEADKALAEAEALRAKVEELEAKNAEQAEKLAKLKTDARHPGVGFSGEQRETLAQPKPQTPEEAWEQSESLRAEFGNKQSAWLAYVAREGFNPEEVR